MMPRGLATALLLIVPLGCGDASRPGDNQNVQPDAYVPFCGNGIVDPGEHCDTDGLTEVPCQDPPYSSGFLSCTEHCVFDFSSCAYCGDGLVAPEEDCDGTNLAGQDCVGLTGLENGALACAPDCSFDVSDCHRCGNGHCEPTETTGNCPEDCAIESVSAGVCFTCARVSGTIRCWGCNSSGQLGNGSTEDSTAPVAVHGLTDAVQVSTGGGIVWTPWGTACAVVGDGTVWCWGAGPLGDGTFEESAVPVQVDGLTDAVSVSVGWEHACALKADGHVVCWGDNGDGALGDGTYDHAGVPVPVTGLSSIVAVSAGPGYSCAASSVGATWCWGSNDADQLGPGTQDATNVPVQVPGVTDTVAISTGGNYTGWSTYFYFLGSSNAVTVDGVVYSWGHGPLGDGTEDGTHIPTPVVGLDAVETAGGRDYTCALSADGTVWCWGDNQYGKLGNGSTEVFGRELTPVQVVGVTSAVSVSTGFGHTCSLLEDGTLWCWGENDCGQLGDGSLSGISNVPVQVQDL